MLLEMENTFPQWSWVALSPDTGSLVLPWAENPILTDQRSVSPNFLASSDYMADITHPSPFFRLTRTANSPALYINVRTTRASESRLRHPC